MIGAELIKEHPALRRWIVAEVVGAGVSLHIVGAPATDQGIVAGTGENDVATARTIEGIAVAIADQNFGSAGAGNIATTVEVADGNAGRVRERPIADGVVERTAVSSVFVINGNKPVRADSGGMVDHEVTDIEHAGYINWRTVRIRVVMKERPFRHVEGNAVKVRQNHVKVCMRRIVGGD